MQHHLWCYARHAIFFQGHSTYMAIKLQINLQAVGGGDSGLKHSISSTFDRALDTNKIEAVVG